MRIGRSKTCNPFLIRKKIKGLRAFEPQLHKQKDQCTEIVGGKNLCTEFLFLNFSFLPDKALLG